MIPPTRGAALVTGAARRLGRVLALAAADAGFDVAVHARVDHGDARTTEAAIRAKGRAATLIFGDLADPEVPARLVAEAAGRLGPLTLLVNNASLFDDDRLQTLMAEGFDAHVGPNLRAPILLAQAFAAQVQQEAPAPAGMIVNLLDQRVWKPTPQFFSYAITKAGLWEATRMMAQALAPRVRVNGIGPGPTLASIHQAPEEFAAESAATLLQKGPHPEEIAQALLYLIDARSVTGQMIAVDSGQHLTWG